MSRAEKRCQGAVEKPSQAVIPSAAKNPKRRYGQELAILHFVQDDTSRGFFNSPTATNGASLSR